MLNKKYKSIWVNSRISDNKVSLENGDVIHIPVSDFRGEFIQDVCKIFEEKNYATYVSSGTLSIQKIK